MMISSVWCIGSSSEPGCSRDQKQPCRDDDGPDGLRDALTHHRQTVKCAYALWQPGTGTYRRMASGLLRFPDVAEVEGDKKENEVKGRTYGNKLWRLNKARADKRHRNAYNGKIELDSRAHEKRARQELSEISASYSKINRHNSPDDDCSNKN
jgi:hypothetical protein